MAKYIDNRIAQIQISENNNGFVAIRDIPKFSVILIEKPFKLYRTVDHMLKNISHDLKKFQLEDKFDQLYPRNMEKDDKNYYYEKIIKNAFNFDRTHHAKPCILFHGAIFNHSCVPNVLFVNIDEHMIFYTVTDIKKGDQLYDHYIDVNKHYSERKELLLQYGFICKCSKCVCSGKEKNFSRYDYKYYNKQIIQKC